MSRSVHFVWVALNIPVVLLVLYLFAYCFFGLWNPAVAANWWWLAVLALPMTAAAITASHRLWVTNRPVLSNWVAAAPVFASLPIWWHLLEALSQL